jgi:D-psicose/D-tagatose/L-ribulose 3-epimerase
MRPAISNIAWPSAHDDAAVALAASVGFAGIEVAPMKLFGPLHTIELADVRAYRRKLSGLGLAAPALQGILFGTTDVHLFASDAHRRRLHTALLRVADIAIALNAESCVFGAPTLRDPGELPLRDAWEIAVAFFRDIGETFAARGVCLCFEANPSLYKCRFVTRTAEAFDLVNDIASPGVRMQLDTGTIFINGEAPNVIEAVGSAVAHCHVSEPNLAPLGSSGLDHRPIAEALTAAGYMGWVSVEMRVEPAAWQVNIVRAALLLNEAYGLSTARDATA